MIYNFKSTYIQLMDNITDYTRGLGNSHLHLYTNLRSIFLNLEHLTFHPLHSEFVNVSIIDAQNPLLSAVPPSLSGYGERWQGWLTWNHRRSSVLVINIYASVVHQQLATNAPQLAPMPFQEIATSREWFKTLES